MTIHPLMSEAVEGWRASTAGDYPPVLDEAEREMAEETAALEEARELLADGNSAELVRLLGAERLAEIVCDEVPHEDVVEELSEALRKPSPWAPCAAQSAVKRALAHLDDAAAVDFYRIRDADHLGRILAATLGRVDAARSALRPLSAADYVQRIREATP